MLCGWRIKRTRRKKSYLPTFYLLWLKRKFSASLQKQQNGDDKSKDKFSTTKSQTTLFINLKSFCPSEDNQESSSLSGVMWFGLPSSGWMGALQVRGGEANRAPTHSALLRLTAHLTSSQPVHYPQSRNVSPPITKEDFPPPNMKWNDVFMHSVFFSCNCREKRSHCLVGKYCNLDFMTCVSTLLSSGLLCAWKKNYLYQRIIWCLLISLLVISLFRQERPKAHAKKNMISNKWLHYN